MLDAVAADQVSTAVTHTGDVAGLVAVQRQHGGRAHASAGRLVAARVDDRLVGPGDGVLHRVVGVDLISQPVLDDARDKVRRHARGHFTAFLAAHAVGHQEQLAL